MLSITSIISIRSITYITYIISIISILSGYLSIHLSIHLSIDPNGHGISLVENSGMAPRREVLVLTIGDLLAPDALWCAAPSAFFGEIHGEMVAK